MIKCKEYEIKNSLKIYTDGRKTISKYTTPQLTMNTYFYKNIFKKKPSNRIHTVM
jgi:hypothetical protein